MRGDETQVEDISQSAGSPGGAGTEGAREDEPDTKQCNKQALGTTPVCVNTRSLNSVCSLVPSTRPAADFSSKVKTTTAVAARQPGPTPPARQRSSSGKGQQEEGVDGEQDGQEDAAGERRW